MSDLMTCEATRSATSSPESVSGLSLSGWRAGQTIDLFGLDHAPANPSVLPPLPTREKDSTTTDICHPSGLGSSASASLTRSLASKLEAATARRGSMTFSVTWKMSTTPAQRLLPVQLVRGLTTSEGAFTSLPTPCARDGRDISRSNAFLSQRKRHSPSLATRLLDSGHSWQVITAAYCLAMNLPLLWNAAAPKDTATLLTRKRQKSSSAQPTK
ncbi:hypothetical protein SAMN04487926_12123 [Paraburkholderia steynii]|uniref:Uncharacterized protein n=1 Tax=Paraburkholderia steynii TaxID=1245441 RepID=A0A7Z7BBX3_9BURK|nr:hypothetical protein SAMN04487926_12123 [Paraburkholderia steynii]